MIVILSADDFGRSHSMNLAIDYAMRNHLVFSTALLMGSEFTSEAVEMAFDGNYISDVHCHLNLATCKSMGNHFVPLNENYKKSRFCTEDGEFKSIQYYRLDFFKYVDIIFQELETQFLAFQQITDGKANYLHLDFHLYSNMSPPVAAAYSRLIKKYHIQSARFFGEHQPQVKESRKRHLVHVLMINNLRHKKAYAAKSCKVEHLLTNPDLVEREKIIELYVHPDYVDNVLLDKTKSAIGRDMKPLEEHIAMVKQLGDIRFVSWASMNK